MDSHWGQASTVYRNPLSSLLPFNKRVKNSLERLAANPSCREIQRRVAATDILDKELLLVDICHVVGTVDLYVHWPLSVNVTRIKGTTIVTKTFT